MARIFASGGFGGSGGGGTTSTSAQCQVFFNGGGSAITASSQVSVRVPYDCTVTGWQVVADVSGSIVVDVWRDSYGNWPPTSADSIAGSEKPTLSSQQTNQDTSLSTWSTALNTGEYLRFNVDSATTVTQVWVTLILTRS